MKESPWVTEEEASLRLGVTEKTLRKWREIGYLKPGTHWRSAPNETQIAWKPIVIYHLSWCKEMIDYLNDHDVPLSKIAA